MAIALAGLLLVLPPASARADEQKAADAKAAFAVVVDQVSAILQSESATPDEKRAGIAYALGTWLDMPVFTRSALGPHAEQFSPDQRVEFAQVFRRYLISVYTRRIARSATDPFEILGADWDEATGTAVIRTWGGRPIAAQNRRRGSPRLGHVDYRLRPRGDTWQIVNIVIDGVNSIRLFRSQFERALERGDPDALIARVREINADLERTNPFAAHDRGRPPGYAAR